MNYDLLVEQDARAIERLLNAREVPQHDERGTISLPERIEFALGLATTAERERCAEVCFLRAEELARRAAFEQYGNQRRERDIRGREATRCGSVIRNGEAE